MFLRLESVTQLFTRFCPNLESAGLHQMILILSLTIGDCLPQGVAVSVSVFCFCFCFWGLLCLPQGVAAQQLLRWKSGRNKGRLLSSAASRTVSSGEELVFFWDTLSSSRIYGRFQTECDGPKSLNNTYSENFLVPSFSETDSKYNFFRIKKNETVLGPERHTLVAKNKSTQGLP